MKKLIPAFVFLFLAGSSQARIITVDDDGPADFNNIQAAINDANNGDTVIVANGMYTGDGNRDIEFLGKSITLRSENGPEKCIIDCNGTETEPHRGFYFHSGEDANSVLDGFTITYGYASGGSMLEGSSGGIYCNGSSPTIINCIISGNSAGYYGGGMSNCESSPMLINCIFSGNSANSGGGGIFNYDHSSPNLINCILKANSAIGNGGGMNNMHNSNPTIVNCTFNGNSTDMQDGGGMYNHESDPTLINCIFTGNSAYNCGGGIRNDGFYPPPTNNLFRDNWASDEDMMSNLGCDLILTNCTFFANSATYGNAMACNSYGGLRPSNVRLTNSILWNGGNEIWNNDNSTIIITYSAVQGGWQGLGNIDADPCFADVNNGDYHLKSQAGRWASASSVEPDTKEGQWTRDDVTSPCIDAGDPMSPIGFEPFPNGGRINMGAFGGTFEASKSYFGRPVCETIVAGDINGDCEVNFKDFALMALHWLECIEPNQGRWQLVEDDTEDSYSCEGNFDVSYPCSNAVDEDWDTYALPADGGATSYIYENYIIPTGITMAEFTIKYRQTAAVTPGLCTNVTDYWDGSTWKELDCTALTNQTSTLTVEIPDDALSGTTLQLRTTTWKSLGIPGSGSGMYYEGKVIWYLLPVCQTIVAGDINSD